MDDPGEQAKALPFAEPTALGLIGLAIGCAALVPIAFGWFPSDPKRIPMMLETSAWMCLLFGGGCQFLAGVMALANKNALGGTLLTAFSFNWVFNWWTLDQAAAGKAIDPAIGLAVDVAFLVIFVVLTYAFGFYSRLLCLLLLDIDVLYALRLIGHALPADAAHPIGIAMGVATIALGAIALYTAFALLVNPVAGRRVFPVPGPVFTPRT
jgi:hypothetical protein